MKHTSYAWLWCMKNQLFQLSLLCFYYFCTDAPQGHALVGACIVSSCRCEYAAGLSRDVLMPIAVQLNLVCCTQQFGFAKVIAD